MGVSTNGQICFGILFDEGYEFPWDAGEFDGDIDEWWLKECGFNVSERDDFYDACGNPIPGTEEKKEDYYARRHAFEKDHPVPASLVNYCSLDAPMYILAVPSSDLIAYRGYPKEFDPQKLINLVGIQALMDFQEFIKKYLGDGAGEPKFYLSSYWG